MRSDRVRKIIIIAMLSALAWILASVIRIPIVPLVPHLGYEPKDVILVIAGFLFGPIAPLAMAAMLSVIEMITSSMTGWLGAVQNFISSCAFCCTAALIYKRWRTLKGATVGLCIGTIVTAAVMMPSNLLFAPIWMSMYLGMDVDVARSTVASVLLPGYLPFNLIKYGLNTALTILLYKPIRAGLSTARLLPEADASAKGKINIAVMIAALLVIIAGVVLILVFQGVIRARGLLDMLYPILFPFS